MKYKILKARDEIDLVEKIQEVTEREVEPNRNGWQLHGDLIVIIDDVGPWYIQALVLK